jgi:hypothetical protein
LLDCETIYWRVRNGLEAAGRPTPQQRSRNLGSRIALVRNRAHTETWAAPAPAPQAPRLPPEPVEEPVTKLETRPKPVPAPRGPRLSPTELIGKIAALRGVGREEANELLDAAAVGRPAQETACLIDRLARDDADRVIKAVAPRSPAEIARLLAALRDLGQEQDERRLQQAVGRQDANRTTSIAEQLKPAARDDLLYRVAMGHIGQPEMIIRLVGALSSASGPMAQALDALLTRLADSLPAAADAALADALRSADRQTAAFRLYQAAQSTILGRPADELITLAATMHAAGHRDQALELIEGTAPTCRTTDRADSFVRAMRTADLPGQMIEDGITLVSTAMPDGELLNLVRRMIRRDQDEDVNRLVTEAAARRSIDSAVTYVRALLDAGRPIDALELTADNADRSPEDVLVLLLDLIEQRPSGLAANLLEATTGRGSGLGKIADLIIVAGDPGDDLVWTVAAFLNTRTPADTLNVALALIRADRRPGARQLLAACSKVLTPALDENTCASYTRLTAQPRPHLEPPRIWEMPDGVIPALDISDRTPGPTGSSSGAAATPAATRSSREPAETPPRRIRTPDRPSRVEARPLTAPGMDPDGLRERAALVVDLIAALPHKIKDLPQMTDGDAPGAPALLVEAIFTSHAVNLTVMASVLSAGAPDFVVAVVEGIGKVRLSPKWCAVLWKKIQACDAPEHYLQIIAERCSPQAIATLLSGLAGVEPSDPQYCDHVLAQVRRHTTEQRRIVVADELARRHAELAAQLLDTGDAAPLDAATQAGLAAARRAFTHYQRSTGTVSAANELRLRRAVITFEAAGLRSRRESVPWSRDRSISRRELAGRIVSWDDTCLTLRGASAATKPHRWATGRADPDTGKLAATTLTTIATYIEEVLNVRRGARFSRPASPDLVR